MNLRIGQYGFTPERYYAIVFAIVLGGYSGGMPGARSEATPSGWGTFADSMWLSLFLSSCLHFHCIAHSWIL